VIAYHGGVFLDTLSQAGAEARQGARESGRVPAMEECRELQKMKNSGNEAKKYLKTKHITFLKGANYAGFARKLAQIMR
jgi:phage portal protein BeeE